MRDKERWQKLCELAAVEQDSEKLLVLIREINLLLEEKGHRLLNTQPEPTDSTESVSDRDSEVKQPKE